MHESKLSALLLRLYKPEELRAFARYRYPAIEPSLPGETASGATLAYEFVYAMERHGLISTDMFRVLTEERPSYSDDIRAVARLWDAAQAPVAPPRTASPPAPMVSGPFRHDIFLGYATPDADTAMRLYGSLIGSDPDVDVFFDRKSLGLGDAWDEVIPDALRASRVILVLVSERVEKAWYTRNEIQEAIVLARDPGKGRKVVPVFLDGRPGPDSHIPYGLRILQGLVLPEVGLEEATKQILALVRKLRTAR
jgi:hypothetical protein